MVSNRKPMFVSGKAHEILSQRAKENKRFIGDEVDILLNIKSIEEIDTENKCYFTEKPPKLAPIKITPWHIKMNMDTTSVTENSNQ